MARLFAALALFCMTACAAGREAIELGPADRNLTELNFLAGSWALVGNGRLVEEHWTQPGGGMLLGSNRELRDGKLAFFEVLRIERREDGSVFYLAAPRGREATPFRMIESGGERVVFENPEHDFPQRILYWLDGDGRLHGRIEGESNGEPRSSQWVFQRAKIVR